MDARTIESQHAYGQVPGDPAYDQFGVYGTGPYQQFAPYDGGAHASQMHGFDSVSGASPRAPDPMGTTRVSGRSDQTVKSYQRYTEQRRTGAGGFGIDPENGIAPRRLTDCVCAVIFVIYVIGMIALLATVHWRTTSGGRSYGDARRLTRGMDSAARLCGVDPDVENKPYLFWCRDQPTTKGVPEGLDLANPECVAKCPNSAINGTMKDVSCLFTDQSIRQSVPGGQFGNVMNFHVQTQQSHIFTAPYETEPFGGHYCMPTNETLKASIEYGPLNWQVRAVHKMGSFEDAWGVLFLSSIIAVVLGYLYILMMEKAAKQVVIGTVLVCYVTCLLSSLFFVYGILTEVPWVKDHLPFDWYKALNPLYTRDTIAEATIVSLAVGVGFLLASCALLGTYFHLQSSVLWELLDASSEVIVAMRVMLIPPAIEALWKFIMMWILCYNCRIFFTVGWIDDHRIVINGESFKGKSARFHYDWHILPWMGYYFYGAVWIMELCTAFGHFLISFAVISWYFMRKEGRRKTGVPPAPPLHATFDSLVYHAGSLCLGAAIIPWTRIIRMFNFIVHESVPPPDYEGNCLVKCMGNSLDAFSRCVERFCMPTCCRAPGHGQNMDEREAERDPGGCSYRFTKLAYCDIIIRSQHFLPASERSLSILLSHKECGQWLNECQVVSIIGVVSIGAVCVVITHVMIMTIGWYNDPTRDSYIDDPLVVDFLAFLLCSNIAYGFMMLFDNTAGTLLYCYAWNRKFNRQSVEKYVPELLKPVVNHDFHESEKVDYKLYGAAKPQMYLSSWLPKKKKDIDSENSASAVGSTAGYKGSTAQAGGSLDTQGYYRGPPRGSDYGGDMRYSRVSNPGASLTYAQYDVGH